MRMFSIRVAFLSIGMCGLMALAACKTTDQTRSAADNTQFGAVASEQADVTDGGKSQDGDAPAMLTTTKTMIETKIFVSSFMPKQCVAWNLKFASPNISLVRTIKFESGDSAQKPAGSSYITMQASTIRDLDGLALLAGAADQLTISGTVGLCNSTTKTAINLIRVPQQRQDLYQKFNLGTNPKPVFAFLGVFFGQKQIVTVVTGCTDPKATNYNAKATVDDGSCVFPPTALSGCTIAKAYNYNPKATVNDGSCKCPIVTGCTIVGDPNYNPQASVDDGTCKNYPTQVFGCMIKTDPNYNPAATLDDGSCKTYPVQILGCMMKGDPNYNALATIDDGSCTLYWQICR